MGSWRTTIAGVINIVLGAAVIGMGMFLFKDQVAVVGTFITIGLGLITAGATGLTARDEAAHCESAARVEERLMTVRQEAQQEARDIAERTAVTVVEDKLKQYASGRWRIFYDHRPLKTLTSTALEIPLSLAGYRPHQRRGRLRRMTCAPRTASSGRL
jgi:hypothetical protein